MPWNNSNTCNPLSCCLVLLVTLGAAFFFLPLILLLLEVLVNVRLEPATCQVKEVLPDNYYDVYVLPGGGNEPFSDIVELVVKDDADKLKEDEKVPCFYRVDSHEGGTTTTVQFHGDRKNVNVAAVVIFSVWLGIELIIVLVVGLAMLCK